MAKFFPDRWDPASPSSETVVRDALETLDSEWLVFSNIRWLDPEANTPDGETDFVVVHPAHGVLVLEVKGGAFELSGGEWSTIDRRGVSRPLGRRGPFQQATEAKHQLKRRLKERAPEAAGRVGQAVCFTSGAPGGDLGLEAPAEIVLSNMDLRHIEERLIRAAQRLGISDPSQPLSRSEIRALTSVLAPSGSVRRDEAQEVAVVRLRQDRLSEHRLRLTVGHIAGLERLRGSRCVAVYGAAGTGKTVLALRRARELLDQGASVLVLCTSAQLVGYYRSVLQAEWPGRLAVGRSSMLLDPGTEVFAADAVIIDEAQNLSAEHLERVPKMVREDGALDLLCDLGQIRDPERRAGWTIPFDHDRYFLLENLRNSEEIVLVLARLGYEGVVGPAGASHAEVEMVECSNGASMRAACVQVAYDLVSDGLKPGQLAIVTEAAGEIVELCDSLGINASTDVWAFGRPSRNRLDVGTPASFQGLERDVVILLEPTLPTSPPALSKPSGSSSLPRSSASDPKRDDDLRVLLQMGASRARARLIVIGGRRLREALALPLSSREIRAQARGSGELIAVHGIRPGDPATARATRRRVRSP